MSPWFSSFWVYHVLVYLTDSSQDLCWFQPISNIEGPTANSSLKIYLVATQNGDPWTAAASGKLGNTESQDPQNQNMHLRWLMPSFSHVTSNSIHRMTLQILISFPLPQLTYTGLHANSSTKLRGISSLSTKQKSQFVSLQAKKCESPCHHFAFHFLGQVLLVAPLKHRQNLPLDSISIANHPSLSLQYF